MDKSLIVDGMSVLKTTSGGQAFLTNGFSFSFFQQLTALVKHVGPKGIFVCWEGGHDHRAALLPGYKISRKSSPSTIKTCRDLVQALLPHLGVYQVRAPGFEADDVAGWLVQNMPRDYVLMTNDRDWLQLIRRTPYVGVYIKSQNEVNKKGKRLIVDATNFEEHFGFPDVETFVRYKIAAGDPTDEIPKAAVGVGDDVIKAWMLGMDIPQHKADLLTKFFAQKGPEYQRNAALVDIRTPHPNMNPEWIAAQPNKPEALRLLTEMGFASILKKFDEWFEHYLGASLADVSTPS